MDTSQFLSAVYDVLRLNYPSGNPDGMTAARAGLLVRRAFPNLQWESMGFPKFKHILEALQTRGWIRVGENQSRALSIWLTSEPDEGSQGVSTSNRPRALLRKDVWNAFVLEFPLGQRFLNRRTGAVRMATSHVPQEPNQWIEIPQLSQEAQKSWASEFLVANEIENDEASLSALVLTDWYRQFPRALALKADALRTSWNRVRTQNVVSYVRDWCESNSIPEDLVFERNWSTSPQSTGGKTQRELREALLRAIGRMSLDELTEICVPTKYLLAELGLLAGTRTGEEY
ncbi:MAG: hypothetical protein RIC55_26550 [Pirellulaceae bacterium]